MPGSLSSSDTETHIIAVSWELLHWKRDTAELSQPKAAPGKSFGNAEISVNCNRAQDVQDCVDERWP